MLASIPFRNPFGNLNASILVGAVLGGLGAEIVHPHAYGLHLFPSTFFTTKGGKRFHIHHWMWALGGMGLYSLSPFKNTTVNSLVVGGLVGVLAQGVSYSTSKYILYDAEQYVRLRAEAGTE